MIEVLECDIEFIPEIWQGEPHWENPTLGRTLELFESDNIEAKII